MSNSYNLGKLGEQQAVAFLKQKGYTILELNWRYQHKEIDIIARYNNKLHIIEVKTRSSDYWQTSNEVVGIAKQKNLIAATEAYIQEKNIDTDVVFDVLYILQSNGEKHIELISNAFYAYE